MSQEKFEHWAIVELFGHQRIAGLISEQSVGGCNFVRVDVPPVNESPTFTKLLGQGAIYAINIVSESVAKAAAESFRQLPVHSYDLPSLEDRSNI